MDRSGLADDKKLRTVKLCCRWGLVCLALLGTIIAAQAVTGGLLSVRLFERLPASTGEAAARAEAFSTLRSLHSVLGQISVLGAVGVLAVSIIFMVNVGDVDAYHTRFSWSQLAKAMLLVLILVGLFMGGRLFSLQLTAARLWPMLSEQDMLREPGITMEAFGQTPFYTFVALHGVVLPLLAVVVIIFMWPPFHEFALEKKRPKLKPTAFKDLSAILESGEEAESEAEEEPTSQGPLNWARMRAKLEREAGADDESDHKE